MSGTNEDLLGTRRLVRPGGGDQTTPNLIAS